MALRPGTIWLLRLGFAVLVLALWEAASGRWIPAFYIGSPSAIGARFVAMLADGRLLYHAWITAIEAGSGFALGAAAGVAAGMLLGRVQLLAVVLDPFLMAFYSLPKLALAPIFVMWFGIDIGMKVIFTAVVVFFLVFLNTYSGVRGVSRELETVFRLMGASERQLVRTVVLPSAVAWVFAGLRLSVPYALVGAIMGELMASNRGLGYLVEHATGQFDTAGALAAVLAIVLLAALLNAAVRLAEKRLMPWRAADEAREVTV